MSTSKVSTSSCLWTPNSAYMLALLPMGTHCAGELQYYTLQSRQFRLPWMHQTRCPIQLYKNAPSPVQTGQTPFPYMEVVRARLHFTQPQWACLKDLFTGISNQTAVVLWGQTEINDGHDPINVCVISKLNSWQIKTEWAIFVTCIFLPERSLLTGQIVFTNSWGIRYRGKGSKMRQLSCLLND